MSLRRVPGHARRANTPMTMEGLVGDIAQLEVLGQNTRQARHAVCGD